ncbi:hypothetical protein SmJEL517_g05586 [Synchytrium microbalum]|uniref:Caffeoyl-CoA O-methyltransferase n=1 Tax=Synchytrium microbalum TaxID=1806994 RepID=A0A507C032_9FUNG|nr:uncharacterized protein SmJEL517_g05586 [Synchytrium microbalum]TPX30965.1 hypothetical protein SmJEL517_g05586 [Synchytrium microbalum]
MDKAARVDTYLESKLNASDTVLEQAQSNSDAANLRQIQVSPLQGAMLQILAQSMQARRVLEIGTLAGISTIYLGRGVGSEGKVVTCEIDEKAVEVAKANFKMAGLDQVIEIRAGAASETLKALVNDGVEAFDLVFIDADKQSCAEYLDLTLQLSRKGTLIIVDNVVRDGKVVDADSTDESVRGVRAMFDAMENNPKIKATAIQTVGSKSYDGFAMATVL